MNATVTTPIQVSAIFTPFATVFNWLISAQKQSEQSRQLAEMPIERLRDLGIDVGHAGHNKIVPMIHA